MYSQSLKNLSNLSIPMRSSDEKTLNNISNIERIKNEFLGGYLGGFWITQLGNIWQEIDGSRATAALSTSDPIGEIGDLSGNGNHMLAPATGQRGLFDADIKASIMDDTDDRYATTSAVTMGNTELTVAARLRYDFNTQTLVYRPAIIHVSSANWDSGFGLITSYEVAPIAESGKMLTFIDHYQNHIVLGFLPVIGTFYELVMQYKNGILQLWIDGVSQGSLAYTATTNPNSNFYIGSNDALVRAGFSITSVFAINKACSDTVIGRMP